MITYRKAEEKDKKDFGKLEREFWKAYEELGVDTYLGPMHYKDIPELALVSLFEKSLSEDYFFHVAEDDGKVIGYVFAEIKPVENADLYQVKRTGFIDSLVVSENHRGKGVGSELLNKTFSWFKSQDVTVCTIGVMKENKKALSLYEKLGFQIGNMKMWKQI